MSRSTDDDFDLIDLDNIETRTRTSNTSSRKSKKKEKKKKGGCLMLGLKIFGGFIVLSILAGIFSPADDAYEKASIAHEQSKAGIENTASIDNTAQPTTEAPTSEYLAIGESAERFKHRFTVLSFEPYSGDSFLVTKKDGYTPMELTVEMENLDKSSQFINITDINVYADGYVSNYEIADEYYAEISSGKKFKTSVVYNIPDNAQEVIVEYKPNMFSEKMVKVKLK